MTDLELVRVRYCYQVGSTFVAAALLEDAVVTSMLVCDRVKVTAVLGDDAAKWDSFLVKRKHLQASTLGSLIAILARHNLDEADLAYLKWLKLKRDFFIHRYFHAGLWPGELNDADIDRACRTLGALELIFHRGAHRIMGILGRAGLMKIQVIPGAGSLAFDPDLFGE